ncbi:MAG: prepilin-type N-terminal cleavage/methylation domain-containing protein [Candidatus Omnitrophota bacterium]|nr:MAG: prepilin-type N-terminal cleavage/methylation domain-containing protein [Candidatus Omnitrophota bacterium]
MKKGFTLMEIMVASVIVVILATIGMGGYLFLLKNAEEKACAINQQAIFKAAYIKSKETGSLGKLDLKNNLEYLGRVHAQIMKDADWFTKFSYFLVKTNNSKQAYAAIGDIVDPDIMKKYGIDPQMLSCPSSGFRYGVNNLDPNLRWEDIDKGTILIGDCQNPTFKLPSELFPAHRLPLASEGNAIAVTMEGDTFALGKEEDAEPSVVENTSTKLRFHAKGMFEEGKSQFNSERIKHTKCKNKGCLIDSGYTWESGKWKKK